MRGCVAAVRNLAAVYYRQVERSAREGLGFWHTWARALYFPDGMQFYSDSFIRVVFCLYYIPSIAFVIAVTHSALQRVVWVLVVPVTQEMERNPYHFSSLQTLGVGLSSIAVKTAPFGAIGISFATVGHKAMNCFVEAMMDAYTTSKGKDYPLTHARLQFVLEKRSRIYTFLTVLVTLAVAIVVAFQQNTIAILSRDEPLVLLAAVTVAVTQGVFVVSTVAYAAPAEVTRGLTCRVAAAAEDLLRHLPSPTQWLAARGETGVGGQRSSHPVTPLRTASHRAAEEDVRCAGNPLEDMRSAGGPRVRLGETSPAPKANQHHHSPPRQQPQSAGRSFLMAAESNFEYSRSPSMATTATNSPRSSSVNSEPPCAFSPPDVTSNMADFLSYLVGDWWTQYICYMRHIGFGMACVFATMVALRAGLIQGLASAALLIMCLNLPHLLGYSSLMVTFAVIRTLRSFRWLQRHPDALLPVCVVSLPYQAVLLNALHHFRRHPTLCSLLVGVNVLLVARAIDLVREYDLTEHGSVHWEDLRARVGGRGVGEGGRANHSLTRPVTMSARGTGGDEDASTLAQRETSEDLEDHARAHAREADLHGTTAHHLLTPSLAIILEDAYEKHHKRPGLVSLDMTIDVHHMRIHHTGRKKPDIHLARHQIIPYGAARRYLRDHGFYGYVLPRLLSLQSPGYFAGAQFRRARVVLRGISITALLLFTLVVCGMIVQAAYPQLRPLPVRVTSPPDQSYLTVDHVVLNMHLLAARGRGGGGGGGRTGGPAASGRAGGVGAVFQWSNVTSPAGEDFYPRLCRRDYYGTSVWELSLLALAPYLFSVDEVRTLLDFMNAHLGSDWVIRQRQGTSCVATDSAHTPTGWGGFYDFYSAGRGTSVVAMRGTDLFSFTDFLIDINLFFETVLYQLMTFVVPGAIVVPKDLVVNLIRTVSLRGADEAAEDVGSTGGAFAARRAATTWAALVRSGDPSPRRCWQNNYRRDFFVDVLNHLSYVATQPVMRPEHVVLTGHSLGGAVAAIVGAQLELEAVAFSAPGIALARKKFNIDLRSIHKYVMTVISTNDIVPALGVQGGELHHVECLAAKRELCHAMEFMVGSLWRSCSSVRERFPAIDNVT